MRNAKPPRLPGNGILTFCLLFLALITACTRAPAAEPNIATPATPTATLSPTASPATGEPVVLTATPEPSPTSTTPPIPSSTPTRTVSPTVTPTYAILRTRVLVRANCRYGPGYPYLYKYGLVVGSNMEVIGRTDSGSWILIRAIGGDNPCWVKASLMEVYGDVMSVAPIYIPLPQSTYYKPLSGVKATRSGDEVTITWNPRQFRPGDETASPPYLLETWVCRDGEIVFTPVGAYYEKVTIEDESGCSEPSRGRVFFVEKHGYTLPVEVNWPPHTPGE